MPTHATLWWDESTILSGGILVYEGASTQNGGNVYQNACSNSDSAQQTFVIAAGTYTLNILGRAQSNLDFLGSGTYGNSLTPLEHHKT
ncbi:MAG: hypothetical protein NTY08_14640 [Proteobacteria bacterium]|nr:hypothetical protein [Pseudomonadota bacterium]